MLTAGSSLKDLEQSHPAHRFEGMSRRCLERSDQQTPVRADRPDRKNLEKALQGNPLARGLINVEALRPRALLPEMLEGNKHGAYTEVMIDVSELTTSRKVA